MLFEANNEKTPHYRWNVFIVFCSITERRAAGYRPLAAIPISNHPSHW